MNPFEALAILLKVFSFQGRKSSFGRRRRGKRKPLTSKEKSQRRQSRKSSL